MRPCQQGAHSRIRSTGTDMAQDHQNDGTAADADAMVAEADTGARNPSGFQGRLIIGICILWSLFQLYIASKVPGYVAQMTGISEFANLVAQARYIHLAFAI